MKIKICSNPKCLQPEQSISEFYKDKQKKDGLRPDCKDCTKKVSKKSYQKHKAQKKNYYIANKKQILQQSAIYNKLNKKAKYKYNQNYYKINKQKIIKQNIQYTKFKLNNNINFKILYNLRGRIYTALKNYYKSLSTMFLIGCEIDYLMYHIQE